MMHRYTMFLLLFGLACYATARAEQTKVSKKDGMPQVLIPAGEFMMGADDADAYGRVAEFPPHKVYLDAYWMDQHEVANEQFVRFLNERARGNLGLIYSYVDLGNPACRIVYDNEAGLCKVKKGYELHPVLAVSWQGAREYAARMGRRLPTEAEWEKAARGIDGRRYPWGNAWDPKKTNTREAGPGHPLPAGSLKSDRSPYGVLDMAGNAREWVEDGWDEDYYLSSPLRNPLCKEGQHKPVVRGGAWCLTEWDARTSSRMCLWASAQRRYMGFRCAESFRPPAHSGGKSRQ